MIDQPLVQKTVANLSGTTSCIAMHMSQDELYQDLSLALMLHDGAVSSYFTDYRLIKFQNILAHLWHLGFKKYTELSAILRLG